MRQTAKQEGTQGPRVLVCGPTDSGRANDVVMFESDLIYYRSAFDRGLSLESLRFREEHPVSNADKLLYSM